MTKEIVCPRCGGYGEIRHKWWGLLSYEPEPIKCKNCKGLGVVEVDSND